MPKNKKLALNSGIQAYQILTNNDEFCIPNLSSILLAVVPQEKWRSCKNKTVGLLKNISALQNS